MLDCGWWSIFFVVEVNEFNHMSDYGWWSIFFIMEMNEFNHGIFLSQKKYAFDLLKKFHVENHKSATTPLDQN